MITTITFEDHGQDFLEWDIDENGKVIDCRPFQFSVWSKVTVTNKEFKVGGRVKYTGMGLSGRINYPIAEIALDNQKKS
jgi:hypothetical protein